MTDFENVISFENLYKAHRRARLGKRHKKEVILFESELSKNLWNLHYELKYNNYKISDYHKFTIYDPKEREIQAISYKDRVVQHSLCDNYLIPLLEKHLIYDNVACRKKKGTTFAIKRLRQFLTSHYKKFGNSGYFVKIDVKKYFDSINHSILKQKLRTIMKDGKLMQLLDKILDSYNFNNDTGIPMGNQSSQCFALLYLNCLDRYFKEKLRIKYYIRYMDDIIAIVPNKVIAKGCLEKAEEILTENKLKINPKSQIIKISKGLNFLGWHFFLLQNGKIIQKICASTKKRILNKVKSIRYKKKINKISLKCMKNSLQSYTGFLFRGKTYFF